MPHAISVGENIWKVYASYVKQEKEKRSEVPTTEYKSGDNNSP